jgi:hypothetical protein
MTSEEKELVGGGYAQARIQMTFHQHLYRGYKEYPFLAKIKNRDRKSSWNWQFPHPSLAY